MPRSRKNVVRRKLADGTVKVYVYEAGIRADADEPRPRTLGDLLTDLKRPKGPWWHLAPNTRRTQLFAVKKLEAVRASILSEIDYPWCERLQEHMSDTPGMANITLGLLQRMFKRAVKLKWMAHNPASGIDKLKTGEGKPWPLWAVQQFRAKAPADWCFILDLAISTGLRVSDIRRLRWSNYDGSWLELVQQKTGEPVQCPLVPEMIRRLNARKRQAKGLTIVTTQTGAPYSKTGFETAWYKVLATVGLKGKGYTFHGLRHTHGTMRADLGESEHTIAAALGHKSVQSSRRYTKNADRRRLLVDAQDRFAAEWQNGKTAKSK